MTYLINLISDEAREKQSMSRDFSEKRILLVDDEADITSSFQIGLEQYGFKVTTYNDPVSALSEFRAELYDLLLVDIRMPGMTGLEFCEKIKHIDYKIEVCFITGFEEYYGQLSAAFPNIDLEKCYILKPIAISDLAKKISKILNIDS
jgi:DNA-binding response OmpR family regulator